MSSYGQVSLHHFSRDFAHRYWVGAAALILALVTLGYLSAHDLIGFGFGILLALLAFVVWPVLLAVYLGLLWFFLDRKRYARAVSVLIGAIILVLVWLSWSPVLRQAYPIIDLVRFELLRSHYLDAVEKTSLEDTPKLIFFDWGFSGHFLLSSSVSYALLYDESDEIALPADWRSAAWNKRASRKNRDVTGDSGCRSEIAHLVERHFYVITTVCQ